MDHLMNAARVGDINALYESIRLDPYILERIDGIPFLHTPLHVAASAGHTNFAIEIISLKPSFGKKLNPDGLSPLDLALDEGYSETVKWLVKFDSELIRVKGKERLTPLHCVAEKNDFHLLAEFLFACPESIKDLTVRGETALHIAVRNSRYEAIEVLLQWLLRTYNRDVLNCRDDEGNTVLHIAVRNNHTQIVKLLVKNAAVIKNEKNLKGLTALDIALKLGADGFNTKEVTKLLSRAKAAKGPSIPDDSSLAGYLISPEGCFERVLRGVLYWRRDLTMEMRNVVLVVAVLIATATFQAVLSPPGGGGGGSDSLGDHSSTSTKTTNITTNAAVAAATTTPHPLLISAAAVNATATADSFLRILLGNWKGTPPNEVTFLATFYFLNSIAFTVSIAVIFIVLQIRPYSSLLCISLLFLAISYGFSMQRLLLSSSTYAGWLMTLSLYIPVLACLFKTFFFSVGGAHEVGRRSLLHTNTTPDKATPSDDIPFDGLIN